MELKIPSGVRQHTITKLHTWYALTDKWMLAQKLGMPRIQLTSQMKLKKKDENKKKWILWSFLEGKTK